LEKDNIAPMVLNPMKIVVVLFLVCLLLTGTVSAKAATSSVSSIVNPGIYSPIYATAGVSYCSGTVAATATGMGELDVSSTPAGASIGIDGSPWMIDHCISLPWPNPPLCTPMAAVSPSTGQLDTGSHSITIAVDGYNSYVGTVNICSQKVTSVDATLAPVTPVPTTTVPTTTAAPAATTATTTVTTTSVTTSATTAPVTVVTSAIPASATLAAVPASGTGSPVAIAGSGSLSVTTTPAGAAVYVDGVQRGVSPAIIPGLVEGSHTVLLKLDGYQDLSAPVSITAGAMNEYSTGMTPLPAGGTDVPATTAAGAAAVPAQTRSPGFEGLACLAAIGALLYLRKGSYR
jgi:hypothetical protein